MAKYIEKEQVVQYLYNQAEALDEAGGSFVAAVHAQSWTDAIKNWPASDVAPVIRCFECDKAACKDGRGAVWCRLFKIPMGEQDFCSLGAKMDETEAIKRSNELPTDR